jgi:hypothetical protein
VLIDLALEVVKPDEVGSFFLSHKPYPPWRWKIVLPLLFLRTVEAKRRPLTKEHGEGVIARHEALVSVGLIACGSGRLQHTGQWKSI